MGTRVIRNGRVIWQRAERSARVTAPEYDERGDQVFYTPIASDDQPWPKPMPGQPWHDDDTGLDYRLVDRAVLRLDQGWGSAAYWAPELRCTYYVFLQLAREGFFDCAASPPTLRYRCYNYAQTMDRVRKIMRAPRLKGRSELPR